MKSSILYTAEQMAKITGFSVDTIYRNIKELNIVSKVKKNRLFYYNNLSFELICVALSTAKKEKSFTKYYPVKSHEVFYIYESKLNNN